MSEVTAPQLEGTYNPFMPNGIQPPGTEIYRGRLYRRITAAVDDGDRVIMRPVAITREQARAENSDYWDPDLGWLRGGKKMEREHPLVEASALRGLDELPGVDEIVAPRTVPQGFQDFRPPVAGAPASPASYAMSDEF